jgi:hypothetical protein
LIGRSNRQILDDVGLLAVFAIVKVSPRGK